MSEPLVCAIMLTKDRPEMRKCTKCGVSGGDDVFRRRRDCSTLDSWCRSCQSKARRALPMKTRKSDPSVYRNYRARNREKVEAHNAVHKAVRNGTLVKKPCERCGYPDSQAHHADYSKQLEVEWLCHVCHRMEHRKYA